MKIIDLLNKIANGEELPKKIKYNGKIYNYEDSDYFASEYGYLFDRYNVSGMLNDEVEIIEEKEMCHKCHKYPAEYNQTYCEFCLGISKLEEKKTPEKIKDKYCSQISKVELAQKYNEIIDYLKSKGE